MRLLPVWLSREFFFRENATYLESRIKNELWTKNFHRGSTFWSEYTIELLKLFYEQANPNVPVDKKTKKRKKAEIQQLEKKKLKN